MQKPGKTSRKPARAANDNAAGRPERPPRLTAREISRRVKGLAEAARSQGMIIAAIRMSAEGDITLYDRADAGGDPDGQDWSQYL